MKGDFSRFTHRPAKHYAGVLKQQGRVDLDADWNEHVFDELYLDETTRLDVIGACGVPKHGGGFDIGLAGGDLSVSPGRAYVDGILCELEGDDVTYLVQPQLPAPEALDPADNRTDLVFLDVWRRHVTALEDADIREVALGGPDTTTRVQTVWQVRVLKGVDAVTCADEVEGWPPAPSGGLLMSEAVASETPDDPCVIPAAGGYRGLENRLYRVEIHAGGALDGATFKWSRDNGAVVFAVEDDPAAQIEIANGGALVKVQRLGHDTVLRFHIGDWVEVLDDGSEYAGVGGTMAQVVDIDEAARVLTLDRDLPAATYSLERHARVRRWDQSQSLDADGLAVAAAGPIALEDGIQVRFAGADFHSGDYWAFPARTATADIEALTDAPPQGILHHFCKLALVTWHVSGETITATIEDCRKEFPPLTELPVGGSGCCTVTVGDGVRSVGDFADIQAALNSSALQDGGELCILPGRYQLEETVVLEDFEDLVISGCGGLAEVLAPGELPAFRLVDCERITFDGLFVQGHTPDGVIAAEECEQLSVRQCRLTNKLKGKGVGLVVSLSEDVTIQDSAIRGTPALALQGGLLHVARNLLRNGGVWIREGSAIVRIEGNTIGSGAGAGVALGGLFEDEKLPDGESGVVLVEVVGNIIASMGGGGIVAVSQAQHEGLGDIEELTIAGNRILECGQRKELEEMGQMLAAGIVLRDVAGARIYDNHIARNGVNCPGCGIFVLLCQGLDIHGNTILDNGQGLREGDDDDLAITQGGIIALYAYSVVLKKDEEDAGKGFEEFGGESSGMALRVHDNHVVTPEGRALLAVAIGPISVVGNTLETRSVREDAKFLERVGLCALVLNLGRDPLLSESFVLGGNVKYHPGVSLDAPEAPFPDGRLLFDDNQVTLRVPREAPSFLVCSVALVSLSDIGMHDNQCVAEGMISQIMLAGAGTLAPTVRAAGNRFNETPMHALFSYFSLGQVLNAATGNQATHCIFCGGGDVVDQPNQVIFTQNVILDTTCKDLEAKLNFLKG